VAIARSKLTAQGQISVPTEIRRRLGLQPGSTLEWEEANGSIVVRGAGTFTWEDAHRALFPEGPPPAASLKELKAAIPLYLDKNRARRRY